MVLLLQKRHAEVLVECDKGNMTAAQSSVFAFCSQNMFFLSFSVHLIYSLLFHVICFMLCHNVLFCTLSPFDRHMGKVTFCLFCSCCCFCLFPKCWGKVFTALFISVLLCYFKTNLFEQIVHSSHNYGL